MQQLTLQPLLKFITGAPAARITRADLSELQAQVTAQQQAKEQCQQSGAAEKLYLAIFQAHDFFRDTPEISPEKLITQIDKILTENKCAYSVQCHPPRHPKNSFYYDGEKAPGINQFYDLACYHPMARRHHRGHHQFNNQYSIFYMRCEVTPKGILFGNLQIDDKGEKDWAHKTLGRVLRRPKNIYRMMIQQAIKHALAAGHRNILFQAGDACEISQWNQAQFCRVTVTEKNFASINKVYEKEKARFSYPRGRAFTRSPGNLRAEVVIKTTPGKYTTVQRVANTPSLLYEIGRLSTTKAYSGTPAVSILYSAVRAAGAAARQGDVATVRITLKKLIRNLTGVTPPGQDRPAQEKEISALLAEEAATEIEFTDYRLVWALEDYLNRWGYNKILLAFFIRIKRVELRGPRPRGFGKYLYYNVNHYHAKHTYQLKDLEPPVRGKTYLTDRNNKYALNFNRLNSQSPRAKVHNWYETEVPAQLKKLGLGYKKVKIYRQRGAKRQPAPRLENHGRLGKICPAPPGALLNPPKLSPPRGFTL